MNTRKFMKRVSKKLKRVYGDIYRSGKPQNLYLDRLKDKNR